MSDSPWPGTKKAKTIKTADVQAEVACEFIKLAFGNPDLKSDEEIKKQLIKIVNVYIRVLDAIRDGKVISDLKLD